MKAVLQRILAVLAHLGFNPLGLRALQHLPAFVAEARAYRALAATQPGAMPLQWRHLFPILSDKTAGAGDSRSHYFVMDLWMARRVLAVQPQAHWDIGSRLDGFLAHLLAAGQPVTMVDIRPLAHPPAGLAFLQADATTLADVKTGSVASLSTLHAAEHFGLGRYGDPIDPLAAEAFMATLCRVLAKGGRLYFATPVGRERVEFNAHRVFSPHTLHRIFVEEGKLKPLETAVITTRGDLLEATDPRTCDTEAFACGLYVFTK